MNKLLRCTKAQQDPGDGGWTFTGTSKIFFWVGMILLMVIVFVIYVQITGNYISSLVAPPPQLSADLMAQRATSTCFTSSSQQSPKADIISKELFTTQQLFTCIGDEENLRVRLRLQSIDGAFTNQVIQTRTGGFSSFSTHFVLVNHTKQGNTLLSPALLEVEVQ